MRQSLVVLVIPIFACCSLVPDNCEYFYFIQEQFGLIVAITSERAGALDIGGLWNGMNDVEQSSDEKMVYSSWSPQRNSSMFPLIAFPGARLKAWMYGGDACV